MAAHRVRDVSAAWLLIDCHSTGSRRRLVLQRAFMLERAHAARVTRDEGLIIEVLRLAATDLTAAEYSLAEFTQIPQVSEPLSAAAVFARATAEMALARHVP